MTVKELAELKGCSDRYIRQLIERKHIAAVVVGVKQQGPGRGGIQYRIPLSTLDSMLQLKYKRLRKKSQKHIEPTVDDTYLEPLDTEALTEKERQQIIYWKNLLDEWHRYRHNYVGTKDEADQSFIAEQYAKPQAQHLSRRTLYRKWRGYSKEGEVALLDKRGKHDNHAKKLTGDLGDIFEYYFLDQSRKTVKLCMVLTELNCKAQGREDLLPLPSEATFQRYARKIPIPYIKYFRYSEKEFIGVCSPYIKRMYEDLESNDTWVADNHTFDILLAKNGQPIRVYLTAFMDVRSRKMMGWCVTDTPSADATIYALKKGCEHHGIPKALYTDNGREFLFHDFGGNGFRKRKKGEVLNLPTILNDLQIEFKVALPRNARAKGIERAFSTIKETFSKLFESYTGGTVLEKPDKLKQVVKATDKLVAVQDFTKQVDTYIQGWYNKRPHMGEGMYGKTPNEVFFENLIEKRVVPQDKLNLMFMRYAKGNKGTLKVGKNGVCLKFYGQELQYFTPDLWRLYFGREVYVRYNPDDLHSVRIYDMKMKFICEAPLKTQLGYSATKDEIHAQQQVSKNVVKAMRAYKKHKGIAVENELKLILDAATENMDHLEHLDSAIIRPIFSDTLPRVVGDYEEPIDLSVMLERLRRVKEEL